MMTFSMTNSINQICPKVNLSNFRMIYEIDYAAGFLTYLISFSNPTINGECLSKFHTNLINMMTIKFLRHWDTENPTKGSGFRCLRTNEIQMDPLIKGSAEWSGINHTLLRSSMPSEITIWTDPGEVSYRMGEEEESRPIIIYSSHCLHCQPFYYY